MDEHRLVDTSKITAIPFDPPFSSFEHVDRIYSDGTPAIRRLFSLARSHDAHTLMIEEIEPAGIISDENDEIKHYVADHEMKGLKRISFWRSRFTVPDESICREEDCVGYAILKHDTAPSKDYDEWHVYEAVFEKYRDSHNCVPSPMKYTVALGGERISVEGLLYAQQNGLNKACAQVALRSLISRINGSDVSYRQINNLARQESTQGFNPAKGLSTQQIQAILKGFGIQFRDFDYTQYSKRQNDLYRKQYPYHKYVYAGVESGMGALLGFHLTGPAIADTQGHIIPFYGHTFNKDTWAPEADIAYFQVGRKLRYIPSENWTSSFLGHDDNFGPDFCVPRLYIQLKEVDYVVELLKPGVAFSGAQAEALALQFLYSVLNQIDVSQNNWLKRLAYYAQPTVQRIVLRAIATNRDTYIQHLSNEKDWSQHSEHRQVINVLSKLLPKALWIVEVSIPQLFPANERKLGDIVLNGGIELKAGQKDRSHFLFVRLPGLYLFDISRGSKQQFLTVPSNLTSHLPVMRLN